MKKLFLIIGAPGSGKTTDAELLAQKYNDITHYSTGDMFRAEVSSKSELGKTIASYINAGNLVPIEIVIKTITTAITNAPTDIIIIDGYPRSTEQMIELDNYLSTYDLVKLINVIEVRVSKKVAQERVLGRARGDDDDINVFNSRMEIYTNPLKDIQEFYQSKNILIKIDGERTIEEVVDEMDIMIHKILELVK